MDTFKIHLFRDSFGPVLELLNEHGVKYLPGALKRLSSERWWRTMLHREALANFENTAIQCGLTHSKASLYISDEAFRAVARKRIRNNEVLRSLVAINELGQEYTLEYLASRSVSNPVNRRNELMARLSGFDVTAKKLDHSGLFITITCPLGCTQGSN